MNKKMLIKITVDICMTICLLLLMPYSMISETAHEWIGMIMFFLFVVHHILNRRWLTAITKGKYRLFRIIQTVIAFVMFVLMIGSMVSGILLSNYIFKDIYIVGTSMRARQVHMFCAYWGFTVMSVHLGIHWNTVVIMTGRLFKKTSEARSIISKFAATIIACYGVYAFNVRHIGRYLLMKIHFVFYDYSENVMFFILDYIAVMALFAFIAYYISKIIKNN